MSVFVSNRRESSDRCAYLLVSTCKLFERSFRGKVDILLGRDNLVNAILEVIWCRLIGYGGVHGRCHTCEQDADNEGKGHGCTEPPSWFR